MKIKNHLGIWSSIIEIEANLVCVSLAT